jgi:spore maturation protein CgeB
LLQAIDEFRPDLLFTVLFRDEIPSDLLAELRDRPGLVTFNWFCDDHWRFDDFTRRYAPLFNACSTTARSALEKYAAIGYRDVIKTQWACNHTLYRPTAGTPYDVTFVGQPHGSRRRLIDQLRRKGIPVDTWGLGWPSGRISMEDMIGVFSNSAINLNLSNASVRGGLRSILRGRRRYTEQVKGRNFEIPGCGGFQISGAADELDAYYEPGREIEVFRTTDELVELITRYLRASEERRAVAAAGYQRTLAEHTYEHRFREIFAKLGFG